MISVKDFGAPNGTDDTDAFLAMLREGQSGETCFVPIGTYMIRPGGISSGGHAPSILSGMKLVGESRQGSILKVLAMPTDTLLPCAGNEWLVADLGFDLGDFVPLVSLTAIKCSGDKWQIQNCDVGKIGRWGISAFGGNDWAIRDCRIAKSVPGAQPPSGAILVTADQGVFPTNHKAIGNRCEGVGISFAGFDGVVSKNRINGCGSGTGIFVCAPPFAAGCIVSENICTNGISGYDGAQGDHWWSVSGFEIWSPDTIIANNVAHDNDGGGFAIGGRRSLVTGNLSYNNGRGKSGLGGFAGRFIDVDRNVSDSTFIGNKSYDTRYPDPSATQSWGYVQQAGITDMFQANNDYARNKLGAQKGV